MTLDLAVIIVSWNVRHVLGAALDSLLADLAQSGLRAKVVLVDSASSDGTPIWVAQAYPEITLIACDDNIGFVRANNLGMRHLGFGMGSPVETLPRAVYLLNPDTVTHAGATRALYDALLSDNKVGLVGARLTYADGTFQHSAFMFPGLRQLWAEFYPTPGRWREGRFNGRYAKPLYEGCQPFKVDFVLGATMMLKREVVEQTGMFDDVFFMYCEEIDWAWRIHAAGWGVQCVPKAHVTHIGGGSSSQARPQTIRRLWMSRLRLFKKHYPAWKTWAALRMIAGGMERLARSEADPAVREAYLEIKRLALGA